MNELIILVSLGLKKRHESDMNIKSIDRREREAKGASRVEQFDFFFKSRCRARAWSNSQTEICIIEFYPFFSNALVMYVEASLFPSRGLAGIVNNYTLWLIASNEAQFYR